MRKCTVHIIGVIGMMVMVFNQAQASHQELTIKVKGYISQRCEIEVTPVDGNQIRFNHQYKSKAYLNIDCNLPMALTIKADHGALKHDDGHHSELNADYQANIEIEKIGLAATISGRELQQGVTLTTGKQIPFMTQGLLTVSLDNPLTMAGRYRDVLHLEVTPSSGAGGI